MVIYKYFVVYIWGWCEIIYMKDIVSWYIIVINLYYIYWVLFKV